ncbi:MAG: hypothetical protein KAR40_16810, partial [Candidatus Sabulitectum sp.]|nr:hypothetical protein [Candidatus Sabulitectum sp.]
RATNPYSFGYYFASGFPDPNNPDKAQIMLSQNLCQFSGQIRTCSDDAIAEPRLIPRSKRKE